LLLLKTFQNGETQRGKDLARLVHFQSGFNNKKQMYQKCLISLYNRYFILG